MDIGERPYAPWDWCRMGPVSTGSSFGVIIIVFTSRHSSGNRSVFFLVHARIGSVIIKRNE